MGLPSRSMYTKLAPYAEKLIALMCTSVMAVILARDLYVHSVSSRMSSQGSPSSSTVWAQTFDCSQTILYCSSKRKSFLLVLPMSKMAITLVIILWRRYRRLFPLSGVRVSFRCGRVRWGRGLHRRAAGLLPPARGCPCERRAVVSLAPQRYRD